MKPDLFKGCALTLNHGHFFLIVVLYWHLTNTPCLTNIAIGINAITNIVIDINSITDIIIGINNSIIDIIIGNTNSIIDIIIGNSSSITSMKFVGPCGVATRTGIKLV
jgi:hypothetical protein